MSIFSFIYAVINIPELVLEIGATYGYKSARKKFGMYLRKTIGSKTLIKLYEDLYDAYIGHAQKIRYQYGDGDITIFHVKGLFMVRTSDYRYEHLFYSWREAYRHQRILAKIVAPRTKPSCVKLM